MKLFLNTILFFSVMFSTGLNGEELVRNGDFSKTLPLTGFPLGWFINNGGENISQNANGICMKGKFRVQQRIEVSDEASSTYLLTVRFKVEAGEFNLFTQAFFPGVVKRESYYTLASAKYKTSPQWQEIKLTLQIPQDKITDQIQISFSSDSTATSICVSSVSLVPVPLKNNKQNNIFLSSAGQRTLCKGIYVSRTEDYFGKIAAKTLQKHLYRMTGYVLPIIFLKERDEADLSGSVLIGEAAIKAGYVTETEMMEIGDGGFQVKNKDMVLSLTGKDDSGLISGVYELLKTLGVKFLSSEEIEYPQNESLIIESMRFSLSPAFPFRSRGGIYNPEFILRSFIASPKRMGGNSGDQHTTGFLVNFDKYHKAHPEYFALQENGERLSSKPFGSDSFVHLCMSNPDVQKTASENLVKWIELDPFARYFFIGQGDGYSYRCVCENCKAMDVVEGNYTDRVLAFVNKVSAEAARKYPDKIFFVLLYEGSDKMPARVIPAPHLRFVYCPFRPKWWCHSHAFCKYNQEGMKEASEWFKKYPGQLYVFDYPAAAQEGLSIFGSFYAMVEKIRFYSANGVSGLTLCGTPEQFNALFIHVISRLLWNPGINVEQTIDEFMSEYYGPAAPFMRGYFNQLYEEIEKRQIHQNCELFNSGVVSESFRTKAYALFALAENAVKGNSKLLGRVENEKLFLLYNDLNEHNPYTDVRLENLRDFAGKLAEFVKIAKKNEIFYIDRKHDIKKWLWRKAGLKLGEPWFKDPEIEKLFLSPLETLQNSKNIVQRKITGGWQIDANAFKGGELSADGKYIVIRRAALACSIISCDLFLDGEPQEDMFLTITGQGEPDSQIEVYVNSKLVSCPMSGEMFKNAEKTSGQIKIPQSILRKGKNTVEMKNTTQEYPVPEGKNASDSSGYRPNPFWGWLIVNNIQITKKGR